jgi:DNA-binding transcriptional ArsR family regulator
MRIAVSRSIGYSRWMDADSALAALAALSHPTRLDAFRLLVRHEPDGLATGALVAASGLSQSTFSTHLAVLAHAGLVTAEKRGRQQIQRARIDGLRALMVFLARDCCEGRAELCAPLLAELACC